MKNKRSLLLPLLLATAFACPTPATALQCRPRSFGDPLANTPPPQWLDLLNYLDALRQQLNIERVRLKVFDMGPYRNTPPQKFLDQEEILPQEWSELPQRLDQIRGDRSTDVRMEISNATYNYDEEPFLIIEGGPPLSIELADGRSGAILYRLTAVGTDLSQLVGCY